MLDELLQSAQRCFGERRFADARALCERGLEQDPQRSELRHLLAFALANEGKPAAAAEELGRVLAVRGDDPRLLGDLGSLLTVAGQYDRAAAALRRALGLAPNSAVLHYNLGNACLARGALAEARASYRRATELDPSMADAFNNLGAACRRAGDLESAIASFRRAVSLDGRSRTAHANLGIALARRGAHREALPSLKRALELDPGHMESRLQFAQSLACVGEWAEAFALYDALVEGAPPSAHILNEYGAALLGCGMPTASLPRFDQAIALDPAFAEAYVNRATALLTLKRFDAAASSAQQAFKLAPQLTQAVSVHLAAARALGNWSDEETLQAHLVAHAQERPEEVDPFALLRVTDDPRKQLRVARAHAPHWAVTAATDPSVRAMPCGRIRLCYLSGDFRAHPVGESVVELLELHDRSRFEVIGASWGPHDGSAVAERIRAACDQFVDLSTLSDAAVSAELRRLNPDIAIDLVGFTAARRPVLLPERPAPIIVNYLGYPGTLGARSVDYLLADRTVIPIEERAFYDEHIAWLPQSFFPTDTSTPRDTTACSRAEQSLPTEAVVLCGFCNLQKLSAAVFSSWMRILTGAPQSVLWLQADAESARRNLRQAAELRGVDPARLIFAGRLDSRARYLARLALGDLMLDTFPYNGHSTSRDALWAGLPVLTRAGRGMASRVSAGLLHALGLDALIAHDQSVYEALAIDLAVRRAPLQELRAQLEAARAKTSLFATAALCGLVESAFTSMVARRVRGLPPEDFEVSDSPGPPPR